MADFDVSSMLAAASKGKLGAAPSAAVPAPDAESSVIDVGGPSYSPAIPKGQQGSQVVVSPGQASAAPPDNTALTSPPPILDVSGALQAASKGEYKGLQQGQQQQQSVPGAVPPSPAAPPPSGPPPPIVPKPPTGMNWTDIPKAFTGSLAATLDAIPRGVVGDKVVSAVNAGMQTPFHMLGGMQGPGAAYNEAYDEDRAKTNSLSGAYPLANLGGGLTGALAGGAAMGPSLGMNSAAGLLPKLGAAGSYLGRNAAFGGLMSAAQGGDPTTGAAFGAAIPALGLAGSAIKAPFKAAYGKVAPLLGHGGQEASVGNTLSRNLGSSQIESSPVGPLNLAQATNNPEIAAQVDLAPAYNKAAQANLGQAQQSAVNNQIGKIGATSTGPDAAAALTKNIQAASDLAEKQENALWNVPWLTQATIPTSDIKSSVSQALNSLPSGLQIGVKGNIKSILKHLQKMPDQETVGNLNSIRTAMRLAGKPTESNPWAPAISHHMQSAFLDSMDRALNGPGVNSHVEAAWLRARDFTRNLRTGPLGGTDMKAVLDEGNKSSEVSRRLFNFSLGSPEGPQAISELSQFIDGLPAGKPVADNIKEAARSYLAAAMRDAGRVHDGQILNPKTLQDFIRKNEGALLRTGILEKPQMQAFNDLSDYTDMLRRPDQLLRQVNSATHPRGERAKTFIDDIISPWLKKGASLVGMGAMGAHGGIMHGGVGMLVGEKMMGMVSHVEDAMRSLKAEALFNPQLAQALVTKSSPANRALLSPRVRGIIDQARATVTSEATQLLPRTSNENKRPLQLAQ